MSKQIDKALSPCNDAVVPVFCPDCCRVIPAQVVVFGTFGEREMMYFAEILLEAHRRSYHGGKQL